MFGKKKAPEAPQPQRRKGAALMSQVLFVPHRIKLLIHSRMYFS